LLELSNWIKKSLEKLEGVTAVHPKESGRCSGMNSEALSFVSLLGLGKSVWKF